MYLRRFHQEPGDTARLALHFSAEGDSISNQVLGGDALSLP
jgi:hypothetical protein